MIFFAPAVNIKITNERKFVMRKKGKIVSIVLSVVMLMQIFAIASFAAETPGNVHWATENDEFKSSDADLVFELVDGIELYKITLYNFIITTYFI